MIRLTLWSGFIMLVATMFLGLMAPEKAEANLLCGPSGAMDLNFGTATTTAGMAAWTCQNYSDSPVTFTLCGGIGTPSYPGVPGAPVMLDSTGTQTLDFNIYEDAAMTEIWTEANPVSVQVTAPAGTPGIVSGSLPYYARIEGNSSGVSGTFTGYFYNTIVGFIDTGNPLCQNSLPPDFSGAQGTLTVTAERSAACTVQAGIPVDLGTVSPTATAIVGSTTISITCPTGIPYYIGLMPSNGDNDGAGILSGSSGNPDHPPYQLRSISASGPIWGNSATETSVGNGVGGAGSGNPDSHSVFVVLPDADFRPDSYADTVTVNVHY
jgi:spore coat protein U-like protein